MTRMLSWVLMPTKPMSSGRFKRLNTEFCSKLSLLCANICRFSVFFHFWRREWRWRQSTSLPAIYLQSHSVFEERLLIIMECVTGSKRCAGTEMWTVILLLEGFIYNASQQDTTCHHQRNCWLVLRWAVSGVQV
jgi:hypothetical protein